MKDMSWQSFISWKYHSLIRERLFPALHAESSEAADPNCDHSSSEWASFPFTRFCGKYMGRAHSLDNLFSEQPAHSSVWACLANGSEHIQPFNYDRPTKFYIYLFTMISPFAVL